MKKILLSLCLSLFLGQLINAQCVGLRVIGFNADTPDQILLEATSDIPANTKFWLTDREWDGTNFTTMEETVNTWTSPSSSIIPAGSTILIQDQMDPTCGTSSHPDAAPALSTNGDELYILSAHPDDVTSTSQICFAVLFGGTGDITGFDSVDLGPFDNAEYDASLGPITDASSWFTSNNFINLTPAFCGAILPIELTDFSAVSKDKMTELTWETATETNNQYFTIEHSVDGRNFAQIGMIEGAGNAVTNQYYDFSHETPAKGDNYYRLKQVDFDGAFSYSNVEVVRFDFNGLTVRPTLANDNITVILDEVNNTNTTVAIYDLMGRMIISDVIGRDVIQHDIAIAQLQSGSYIVVLQSGNELHTQRFVKL